MIRLTIFLILVLSQFTVSFSFADCRLDNDWPDKPCLDMPPYPKIKLEKIWDEYYSSKGKVWMDFKKAEMEYAIEKGILIEWLSYGTNSANFENHNVYFYYFLYDEAPSIGSYQESLIRAEDQNQGITKYSDSRKNIFDIIITYYYISLGGLLVFIPLVSGFGIVGLLLWRKRK